MKPLLYLPDVARDVAYSSRWYDNQQPGLGRRFLAQCELVYQRIALHPELYTNHHQHIKRVLVRHFPFAVYYRIAEKHIEIIAVLSTHNNPENITNRLSAH